MILRFSETIRLAAKVHSDFFVGNKNETRIVGNLKHLSNLFPTRTPIRRFHQRVLMMVSLTSLLERNKIESLMPAFSCAPIWAVAEITNACGASAMAVSVSRTVAAKFRSDS